MGGVPPSEMGRNMYTGWVCFWDGVNEDDPEHDTCDTAFRTFLVYVFINFIYNFLLLIITKRGSAVLLVISQALSLPVTNITFSLPAIMGSDAEALSLNDLLGLVLVCIGFLLYSGFGFAEKFMVAQGPPGQMTFASVDKGSTIVVNKDLGNNPKSLASFLTRMATQKSIEARREAQRERRLLDLAKEGAGESTALLAEDNEASEGDVASGGGSGQPRSGSYGAVPRRPSKTAAMDDAAATRMAIGVAERTIELLHEKLGQLMAGHPAALSQSPSATGSGPGSGGRSFKRLGYSGTDNSSFSAARSGWSFYAKSSDSKDAFWGGKPNPNLHPNRTLTLTLTEP